MSNCFNHGDREAAARCAVCGKSLCEECVIRENNSTFCSAECKEKAAATTERARDVLAEKAKTDSARLVRRLIYIFILIAAAAAAWYFFEEHEDKVERKFERSVESVEKSTSKLMKNIKDSLD